MAMIAFYAGLIVGILMGCLILSLVSFFLVGADAGFPGPPEKQPQEKPVEL